MLFVLQEPSRDGQQRSCREEESVTEGEDGNDAIDASGIVLSGKLALFCNRPLDDVCENATEIITVISITSSGLITMTVISITTSEIITVRAALVISVISVI